MKYSLKATLCILSLSILGLKAEAAHPIYLGLDGSFGTNGSQNVFSMAFLRTHALGKQHRLLLSYGLRFSSFGGRDMEFYSAPPDFYLIPEKTDTLFMSNGGQNNVALFIGASYKVKNLLVFGFNIDAVGYTFGKTRTGQFNPGGSNISDESSPNQITALLVGANDIGMIKAEFEVGVLLSSHLELRTGLSNMFLEYKTSKELQAGNDRFRAASSVGFLGVRIYL